MEEIEIDYSYLEILLPILRKHDPLLNEADLYNPDPSLLMGVLMSILEHIGMNVEMILTPQPHSIKIFENNTASYTNSVKYMNLALIIKQLLKLLGYHDFSFGDILRPRQPKISHILTVLINFVQHKEENEQIVCSKIREIIDFDEKIHELEEELQKIEQELPQKMLNAEAEKALNLEKLKEISQLESKVSSLKTVVETHAQEFEDFKKQNAEKNIKLKNFKFDNDEMKRQIESLTNNIVKSPQKIIEDAEKCQQKLNYLSEQSKDCKSKVEEARLIKNTSQKTLQRIEACENIPDALLSEINKIKNMNSEVNDLVSRNFDLSTSIQNAKNEIQYYQEQLEIKHLATKRLEANLERKRDDAKKKLEQIQSTKEDNITEIKNLQLLLKQTVERKKTLESEFNNFDVEADDDINRYNYLCEISSAMYNLEKTLDV